MLQYAEKAIIRARQVANKDPHIIRIGNSTLNPCKVLLDVWNTNSETHPQFKMKIVPFDHGSEFWPPVSQTLGKDFDVMVGAYDPDWSGAFQSFRLGEYRVCVAVSREHPFARKDMISVTDLHDERLVMLKPGISPLMDEIRRCLLTEHPEIHLKGFDHYHIDVFNRCEESGAILLTLDGWRDVHPSLVTIPVDWAYTIPYGMLYPLEPSNSVLLFLRTLQEAEFSNPG
jgi:DNA-binding transcriptional LysR family regulator